MTHLRKIMLEELQRRNYSDQTIRHYVRYVREFAEHFGKSPDQLGPDDLRTYQAYLFKVRKLATGSVVNHVSALRFFFVRTLRRNEFREFIPIPKERDRLPDILSTDEIARMINASGNEVVKLKVGHIDSDRMIIRVVQGKGGKDRDLPLSPMLLETLREYWRWRKTNGYLFPSPYATARPGQAISDKTLWLICREVARRAGIRKRVTPHTLRHSWATHLLETGTDLRTIQLLLGHEDLEVTARYLHVSRKHLNAVSNPLDGLALADLATFDRSFRRGDGE